MYNGEGSSTGASARVRVIRYVSGMVQFRLWLVLGMCCDVRVSVSFHVRFTVKLR